MRLIALISAFLLSGCAMLDTQFNSLKPTASVSNVAIADFNFDSVTLLVDVLINNPNPMQLSASGFDMALNIDGAEFTRMSNNSGIALKPKAQTSQQVALNVPFKTLLQQVSHLKDKNEFAYDLNASLSIAVPALGNVAIPLAHKGVAPVPKAPKVSFEKVGLSKVTFSEITLDFTMLLENNNKFAMLFQQPVFNVGVNNANVAKLTGNDVLVNSQGKTAVPLSASISLLDVGTSVLSALRNGDALPWSVDATALVSSPDYKMAAKPLEFSTQQWVGK